MKKKYVLKSWVKEGLFWLSLGLITILLIMVLKSFEDANKKAVNTCVDYGGSSYETCFRGVYGY